MKVLVATCLFLSMFSSAWLINEKIKREYFTSRLSENSMIQLFTGLTPIDLLTEDTNVFEKFKPREYVRVVAR
jgi:hypothetical protein